MRYMTSMEYRRRAFNRILTECFVRLQIEVLDKDHGAGLSESIQRDARSFAEAYYADLLDLEHKTIDQTRRFLAEAGEFVHDAMNVAEELADEKKEYADKEGIKMPEDEEPELSDEDQEVIDQLFDVKRPDPEISKIRDNTVKALVAEEEKSREIKDAIDIAQSQVQAGDSKALEETVRRINGIGPTSLMNGIMNHFSTMAVKNINEAGNFSSVQDVMKDNRELIKDRSVIMYSLFETSSVLGLKKFSEHEIKDLAYQFYMGN